MKRNHITPEWMEVGSEYNVKRGETTIIKQLAML